jgi:PiT family inorganic phosphate transporter
MDSILLITIVVSALWYDFVNGFHDAANAIATTIATRALSPRHAIILAQTLNFVGALLHTAVAYTIGTGVVDANFVTLPMLLAALLGAVGWGYFTWYFGLPSSSTHALVGGLIGVALFASGWNVHVLVGPGIRKIILAMIISPVAGFTAGLLLVSALGWITWKFPWSVTNRIMKRGQVASAMFMAYSHGMNDAQNAMGIIAIALLSAGVIHEFHVPLWVRVASALAMGIGTSVGGWRIIRTMGHRMAKLEPIDGCAAETAAGAVNYVASLAGAPISTTHAMSTAIMGAASAGGLGLINWRIIKLIFTAWILTFPGAALFAIISYLIVTRIF